MSQFYGIDSNVRYDRGKVWEFAREFPYRVIVKIRETLSRNNFVRATKTRYRPRRAGTLRDVSIGRGKSNGPRRVVSHEHFPHGCISFGGVSGLLQCVKSFVVAARQYSRQTFPLWFSTPHKWSGKSRSLNTSGAIWSLIYLPSSRVDIDHLQDRVFFLDFSTHVTVTPFSVKSISCWNIWMYS